MKPLCLLLFGTVLLLTPDKIQSDNVLFLGLPIFSHLNSMTFLAKELYKKGHNSYFPVTEKLTKILKKSDGVHFLQMKDDETMDQLKKNAQNTFGRKRNTNVKELEQTVQKLCDNYLLDEDWFKSLELVNASFAIVDGVYMSTCLAIIPYKMSIPFAIITAQDLTMIRTPWVLSAFPVITIPSEQMNFVERTKNVFMHLRSYIFSPLGTPSKAVKYYAPQKPDIPFTELLSKAALYIVESDVLIDYALPALPNVEYLGGMATYPAKPLKDDLLKFVNSSENGIILVSFGTVISSLPKEHLDKMAEAFKKIKYDVVWKWSETSYSSKNVFITKWMPQNDLLGHPKTKLFITHCGNGGQFESFYHGVPMLGFPVFGDQPDNGRRIVRKGFGISMDLTDYTVDELVANINELIDNPKYKKNIKMASDIFKSRPEHPSVRGARIVNDVIKYGGGFLRSHCQDMPLYQYFMLDILAVVLSSAFIGIFIVVFILRKCFSFFCRKKVKSE